MARDDRFKRVQEAGADFLETARSRAEEFLKELSRAGEGTSGRAQGALDEIIEGSRRGTEQLVDSIRKEISTQLGGLGIATKQDLVDLERRLTAKLAGGAAPKATVPKATAPKATASKAAATKAPVSKASTTTKGASKGASKAAATKSPRSTTKRAGTNTPAG